MYRNVFVKYINLLIITYCQLSNFLLHKKNQNIHPLPKHKNSLDII